MGFDFFVSQHLYFGPGKLSRLPDLAGRYGRNLLLITGAGSFVNGPHWEPLQKGFDAAEIVVYTAQIQGEPGPDDIDEIVKRYKGRPVDVVAAVGGGSVLDAGKAVSAMLVQEGSVTGFLEGVGTRTHDGRKKPFIAVPTTAGTGSEATKNAVISRTGENGFKKSLRHDNFMPDAALVDPELALGCPAGITAACGMDALTQLLESLVSTKASPMTDALCTSGLQGFGTALQRCVLQDPEDLDGRSCLAYGAYLSGVTLANAGLGVVHGFASVIGGIKGMPHGKVCGTLLAAATRENITALMAQDPGHPALEKYARAGWILAGRTKEKDWASGCSLLMDLLDEWTNCFDMPKLGAFGITLAHIGPIADAAGQKNNPVHLSGNAMKKILEKRL
ncbi:MAG: iron-containing alcohol dehydrogenase [Desulfotignum sp.]|nr:iron-containing alcohol dehydrogenase [Desulfotignum sp.]